MAIGLGVGLGVGIPLIAAVLGFLLWRRRRQQSGVTEDVQATNQPEKYQYAGRMPHEVMSKDAPTIGKSELPGEPTPVELDGTQTKY
jgi:hypothetical protein